MGVFFFERFFPVCCPIAASTFPRVPLKTNFDANEMYFILYGNKGCYVSTSDHMNQLRQGNLFKPCALYVHKK